MELSMSLEQVNDRMVQLHASGESLNKKHIKKTYPDLMRNALHYYPSWEHALQRSGIVH